jgi:hypothetical protein
MQPRSALLFALGVSVAVTSGCADSECDELSVAECKAEKGCSVLRARSLDTDAQCQDEPQEVGCQDGNLSCGGAITIANDPRGNPWLFTSTCIPKGWNETQLGSETPWQWPECSEE